MWFRSIWIVLSIMLIGLTGCKQPSFRPIPSLSSPGFETFFNVHDDLSQFLTYLTMAVYDSVPSSGSINRVDMIKLLNAANDTLKELREEIKEIKRRQWMFTAGRILVSILFGGIGGLTSRFIWARRSATPANSE